MTWYFNFCAPTLPNDTAINFHRGFQTAELMTLMILFALYHTYYRMWGPDPLSQNPQGSENNQNESKNSSEQNKSEENESQGKSQNQDNRSVSIAQKIKDVNSQNDSYISFKKSGDKFLKNNKQGKNIEKPNPNQNFTVKENVSARQIESYFPIVYGHHAIAMAASIMYSPYAQQSIASILYVVFCFLLAMVNSKRMRKCTFGVWIFMAFLNVFIMMSALLEVGQSNWDFVNNVCFAEQYVSLY